jgi:NodT family efflux transporter outer membrane factor (OMF) lipoprotein
VKISSSFFSRLTITAFVIALSACTIVGPDFESPDAPVADEFQQESAGSGEQISAVEERWWDLLGDPVLSVLVDEAYQGNVTLQAAGVRILAARSQLGIAIGLQYPQVQDINGSATNVWTNTDISGVDSRAGRANIGFDVAWEMDVWGRGQRGVESALAGLGASVANYQDVLVSLTAEVARVYVTIRTLEERIEIAEGNVAQQQRSFEIADVRFKSGAVTELDPSQARTLLRQTQAGVYVLRIQLQQARHALATLVGLPSQEIGPMLTGPVQIPRPPDQIFAGVPADLLRRRPDVRAAELRAAAQSAQVGIAEADLYPRFSLFGSVGMMVTSLSGGSDGGTTTAGVGAGLNWPIFNYGQIKNNVRFQDARLEEALFLYRDSVLRAAREVEDGLVAFNGNRAQAELLSDGVVAAKRAVTLSLIQYRDGAIDFQRVLDSQSRLSAVQDSHVAARGNVVLSLISTYKALGGGWQIRAGDEVVPDEVQKRMRERTDWGELLPQKTGAELPEPPQSGGDQPLFYKRPDW